MDNDILGDLGLSPNESKIYRALLTYGGSGASTVSAAQVAREKGYTGDPCPECGHLTLVRNGACMKCQTCGATTGCS